MSIYGRGYTFKDFVVTVNGIEINGFGDETNALEWKWNAARNEQETGVDGFTSFYGSNDFSGSIMMTLQWQSMANQLLLRLVNGQFSTGRPVSANVTIINPATGFTLVTAQSVLGQQPDGTLGNSHTSRKYEFLCADLRESPGVGLGADAISVATNQILDTFITQAGTLLTASAARAITNQLVA